MPVEKTNQYPTDVHITEISRLTKLVMRFHGRCCAIKAAARISLQSVTEEVSGEGTPKTTMKVSLKALRRGRATLQKNTAQYESVTDVRLRLLAHDKDVIFSCIESLLSALQACSTHAFVAFVRRNTGRGKGKYTPGLLSCCGAVSAREVCFSSHDGQESWQSCLLPAWLDRWLRSSGSFSIQKLSHNGMSSGLVPLLLIALMCRKRLARAL
jgi:hypothetical protein